MRVNEKTIFAAPAPRAKPSERTSADPSESAQGEVSDFAALLTGLGSAPKPVPVEAPSASSETSELSRTSETENSDTTPLQSPKSVTEDLTQEHVEGPKSSGVVPAADESLNAPLATDNTEDNKLFSAFMSFTSIQDDADSVLPVDESLSDLSQVSPDLPHAEPVKEEVRPVPDLRSARRIDHPRVSPSTPFISESTREEDPVAALEAAPAEIVEATTPAPVVSSPLTSSRQPDQHSTSGDDTADTSTGQNSGIVSAPGAEHSGEKTDLPASHEPVRLTDSARFAAPKPDAGATFSSLIDGGSTPARGIENRIAQPAQVSPVEWTRDVSALFDQIRQQYRPGTNRLDFQLDPPEFGRLEIRIRLERGRVIGEVTTETEAVTRVLSGDLERLKTSLGAGGAAVDQWTFKSRDQDAATQRDTESRRHTSRIEQHTPSSQVARATTGDTDSPLGASRLNVLI